MEMHKRKAIESAQSAADLKLHLEKYHGQIKEVSGSFLWEGVTEQGYRYLYHFITFLQGATNCGRENISPGG